MRRERLQLERKSYVEKEFTCEAIDIDELNAKAQRIVARENELRTAIDIIINNLR